MNRKIIARKTHCQSGLLNVKNPSYAKCVFQYTFGELVRDDAGRDLTTRAVFLKTDSARAYVIVKQDGILAGLEETDWFLRKYGKIKCSFVEKDGAKIQAGNRIMSLSGSVNDLMAVERVILNLLGRMSGVATFTKKFVDLARRSNKNVLITPTRKTLWSLLDKKACVLGGGGTHRLSLSNAILIKHNHLKAAGMPINNYLEKTLHRSTGAKFVEVEVRNAEDALSAAQVFSDFSMRVKTVPCFIMFDNMNSADVKKALVSIKKSGLHKNVLFEASGRISLSTISAFAKTGVDVLSVGEITHSAPMLDLSMRMT